MISIIIPTWNEEANISKLADYLRLNAYDHTTVEMIVSDGQSTDQTPETAIRHGFTVVRSPVRRRSAQMNAGANIAKGDILYFLHADSFPPLHYDRLISDAIVQGYAAGCFKMKWDTPGWLLHCNLNRTRGGDQSLFVWAETFHKTHGYRNDYRILEDVEIITRLKKEGPFVMLPQFLTTSARRYRMNGVIRLKILYFIIYFCYHFGVSHTRLSQFYDKHIH